MRITILLPHYKTAKMTAYTVSRLIACRGRHEVDIVIIDNNPGDGTLLAIAAGVQVINYPLDKLQSHGIAFDYAIACGAVKTDYFITIESDSFPVKEGWLDYYENLIAEGYEAAGSRLNLSGGEYLHPCGAMYSMAVYREALAVCQSTNYLYFPNMGVKENFDCHLMVRKDQFDFFYSTFKSFSSNYIELTHGEVFDKANYYLPATMPFHNGMGGLQESIKTYSKRNIQDDSANLIPKDDSIIYRIGYEPGQWMSYYLVNTNRKVAYIPTQIKWMPNREGQNQEYTLNEAGFKHIWGVTAYSDATDPAMMDVIRAKQQIVEELYNSIAH